MGRVGSLIVTARGADAWNPSGAPCSDSSATAPVESCSASRAPGGARWVRCTRKSGVLTSDAPGSVRVPQMSKKICEFAAPPRAPALDGALCDAEGSGGVGHRVPLDVHQQDRDPLLLGQGGHGSADVHAQLTIAERIPGGHRLPGALLGQWHRGAHLATADPIQAGVDHDPMQPCTDRRFGSEPICRAKRRDGGVLDGVGRLLRIPHGAQCDGPHAVPMPGDEHPEGPRIARDMGREQLRVRAWIVGHASKRIEPGKSPRAWRGGALAP